MLTSKGIVIVNSRRPDFMIIMEISYAKNVWNVLLAKVPVMFVMVAHHTNMKTRKNVTFLRVANLSSMVHLRIAKNLVIYRITNGKLYVVFVKIVNVIA